jgi:itaconate CoA-transferase
VIKVERPGTGDFARSYDGRVRGLASHFVWTNRGKESLTLDLKHAQAIDVLAAWLDRADVLVQNLAPGAAARLGLSFEALHARHPRLVVCDISGYGDDPARPGPFRDKKAYDLLIQSESGFLSITGTATSRPRPAARSPTSPPACTRTAASSPPSSSAAAPAAAGASTSRCSRAWPSGWATRCTTPTKARRRRRAAAPRTPPSIPTARSRPATAAW